jgi:hypothetical protein
MSIYRRNSLLIAAAQQNQNNADRQPKPGTIIRAAGRDDDAIRVKLEVQPDGKGVFAYATIIEVGTDPGGMPHHAARSFTSRDFRGTKAILLNKSRSDLLNEMTKDPVLGGCEVVPVAALRVVQVAKSGRSITVEVFEFCNAEELELCAGLVAGIEAGVDEEDAVADYYERLDALKG